MKATKPVQHLWHSFGQRGLGPYVLALLISLASAAHAKEIDREALDIYLKGAFAQTEHLIKFAHMPSFSIYCDAEVCPVAKKLSENLRNTRIVERESEGHDADIEILLYKDDRPTSPKYFAKEDEKILTLVDPNCALVQSRRGFEVVKVVVVASAQSSAKENMICVLSEVLRGSGVSVQGRYSEYIKAYLAMDESQFAIALNGFSIFITMHFLEITTPGQDKASVDKALRAKFKIDN